MEGVLKRPAGSGPSFAELLERSYGKTGGDEPVPVQDTSSPAGPAKPEKPSSVPPAPPGRPAVDKTDKLYEQCEALETFLVKILLSGLRNTVQKANLVDDSFAGKMYEDMLYDEYAKDLTRNAGFGLAELAYLELTGQRGKQYRR
jgi:flagellar protein FlgJ